MARLRQPLGKWLSAVVSVKQEGSRRRFRGEGRKIRRYLVYLEGMAAFFAFGEAFYERESGNMRSFAGLAGLFLF